MFSEIAMEGAGPSRPSPPGPAGTGDPSVTSEVQRINRILEIENMDWARQLKQAVSSFPFSYAF